MQTVRTNLNIYYAQLQVAEVAEDVDEVEGEPGGHEHEDHADQEVHRPLTSGVASARGGGRAGPGPEGKLNQIIRSLNNLNILLNTTKEHTNLT